MKFLKSLSQLTLYLIQIKLTINVGVVVGLLSPAVAVLHIESPHAMQEVLVLEVGSSLPPPPSLSYCRTLLYEIAEGDVSITQLVKLLHCDAEMLCNLHVTCAFLVQFHALVKLTLLRRLAHKTHRYQ